MLIFHTSGISQDIQICEIRKDNRLELKYSQDPIIYRVSTKAVTSNKCTMYFYFEITLYFEKANYFISDWYNNSTAKPSDSFPTFIVLMIMHPFYGQNLPWTSQYQEAISEMSLEKVCLLKPDSVIADTVNHDSKKTLTSIFLQSPRKIV